MRLILKVFLAQLILCITALPALAVPVGYAPGTHVSAPAQPGHGGSDGLLTGLLGGGLVIGLTIKKDIGSIATKFVQRAQAAAGDYKTGVQSAGPTWEQATGAAESAYEGGVQAAISAKRFTKGVSGKGSKYQTNAVNLGSQRYGPGVANAQSAYQTGMQPVIAALSSITLPAKSFRGSPANMQRSQVVAQTLAAMRANK